MSDDRWARLNSILHAALMRPPDAREPFVRDACGDDAALRDEVLSLLKEDGPAGNYLERPAMQNRPRFEPGHRLGPYRIDAFIDAGGMGEVYRATDTRLGREVAVKVLPRDAGEDPERRHRFEREARAIGSLKHPNICPLFDVGEHDGQSFLVMELVEGETLARCIERGPLPISQALRHAIEIATALDRAHRQAIVHRDLKPANIIVTKAGVKLIDFGLAKFRPSREHGESALPTRPGNVTVDGTILGTLQYMSPEQVQGREADARSDTFAFGAVLYEMVTGRKAFEGDTQAGLIGAILRDQPPPMSSLRSLVPAALDRVVKTCLEKDPDERWQSAGDLGRELRWVATQGGAAEGARPADRNWARWLAAGVALGLVVTLGVVALGPWGRREPALQTAELPHQFDVDVPESVPAITGLSLSPDGSRVSFVGAQQLWIHDLTVKKTFPVSGVKADNQSFPFWSPDGRFIAYFYAGMLKKVESAGGIPTDICPVEAGRGGSWAEDGTVIFARREDGIFRVSANVGTPVRVTTPDKAKGEFGHLWPHFIRDGRFTYWVFGPGINAPGGVGGVYVGSLDPNERSRRIAALESEAQVSGGFMLAVGRSFTLNAQRFDTAGPAGPHEASALAREIGWSTEMAAQRDFAVSATTLVHTATRILRSQLTHVDLDGRVVSRIGSPELLSRGSLEVAPDGAKLAFVKFSADTRVGRIWLADLVTQQTSPFTSGLGDDRYPTWSPESDEIGFTRMGGPDVRYEGGQDLHVKRLGYDDEERVGESSQDFKRPWHWHRDGTLLFGLTSPSGAGRLRLLRIGVDQESKTWLDSKQEHRSGQFSPNGQWVAYQSESDIWVRRYPGKVPVEKVSMSGGRRPRWRLDGNALYYVEGDSLMEVDLAIGATVKPGRPRARFSSKALADREYAVLPNGKGFILIEPVDPVLRPKITVMKNWTGRLAGKQ